MEIIRMTGKKMLVTSSTEQGNFIQASFRKENAEKLQKELERARGDISKFKIIKLKEGKKDVR